MQQGTEQAIDQRIKQAQRKGIGVYLVSGTLTALVIASFALWLFLVRGFSLIVGPEDALPTVRVSLEQGLAWVGDNNVYTLGGEITLSVSADTFETSRVVVNNQSPSTINVALLPTPATIQATAISDDARYASVADKTQWFLNGNLIHVGASITHQAAPGSYQLSMTNPYYKGDEIDLTLNRAQKLSLSPVFTQVQGEIKIDSLPQGATVYIDGKVEGTTPLSYAATGGIYALKLLSDKFQEVNENVPVLEGFLRPKRNYQLAPKQGELNISAQPNNGLLLINSVEHKVGQLYLDANKTYKVSYSKNGFKSFNTTLQVQASQPQTLDINLKALFSQVTITSNVPAQVTINGKKAGNAPITQTLPSISHTLELSFAGYRTVKQSFVANANKATSVNVSLLTEFDARRAEGKPLFISQLGINMKRFRGNAFTLGSAANEPGRRRNEHELEVDFLRQFWVSDKEITQAQFAAFSKQKPTNAKHPITNVSWLEAAQYCNWLSEQEGLPVFYRLKNGRYAGINVDSRGYRLPTEAEWEWLAKKSLRPASTTYVWGNQETLRNNAGNFADKKRLGQQLITLSDYEDKHADVAEVGSYDADRNGLYDLAGNVSEWVHDNYTNALPDTSTTHIDYLGAPNGEAWVIKGGNFESGRMRELRAAYREFGSLGKPNIGFRVARYDN